MPDHLEVIVRLAVGALLGGLVGLERERLEWAAGLRTHMLVCVGSTLVMLVSSWGFGDAVGRPGVVLDPSRVAAQVISGIGFLGAGTILFLRQEIIRGLTTAASLWTVAAVGLAVGGGLYLAASATTVLVLVILALVKPLERRMFPRSESRRFTVTIRRSMTSLQDVDAVIAALGISIKEMSLRRGHADEDEVRFILGREVPQATITEVFVRLQQVDGVVSVAA